MVLTLLPKNRSFVRLLAGYFLSGLGDQLYVVAIPLLVYELTHSVLSSSTLTAVEYLPSALFGLFIGVLLDRYSRKNMLVGGLLIQAALVFIIPFGLLNGFLPYWSVYLLTFLMATATTLTMAGYEVVLPSLVEKDQLVTASAMIGYSVTTYRMIGPALAGLMLSLMSYLSVLTIDAVSFLLYALVILSLKIVQPPPTKTSLLLSFREGFKFITKDPILRPLIAGFFTANLGSGLAFPLLLFTMKDKFLVDSKLLGLFFTFGAIGSFCGNTLYLRLSKKLAIGTQMIWTGATITVGWAVMGFAPDFMVFTLGYFLMLLGSVWAMGNFYFVSQTRSPEAYRGRTSATSLTLSRLSGPVMAAVGGVLANSFGVSAVFYTAAVFFMLSMVISWRTGLWAIQKVEPADIS